MKVVSYHGKVTVEHENSQSVKVSPCKKHVFVFAFLDEKGGFGGNVFFGHRLSCCEFRRVFLVLITAVGVVRPFSVLTEIAFDFIVCLQGQCCFTWIGCVVRVVVFLKNMFGHVGFSNFAMHVLTINSPTESCLRAVSLKLRSIRSWESQNVGKSRGWVSWEMFKNNLGSKIERIEKSSYPKSMIF